MDQWEQALLADMRHEAGLAGGEPLRSIFFGGGTPSLMPPALVSTLLNEAERLWSFENNIEITLEANPSSVEAANFAALASAGINRVSLGIQSLEDDALRFLGRLHGADEALSALEVAQRHFQRVSFDLIYARPGQSEKAWEQELKRAIGLGTSHLSLYQLTIEPGTRFATDVRRGEFLPLDDDPAADLFSLTRELTGSAGIPAYEISNHARADEESRHNLTYWRYEDYCGIGPGAHGRRNGIATTRHKKPENYLKATEAQQNGIQEARSLSESEQASEALLMGLRLNEGVNLTTLEQRFNVSSNRLIDHDKLEFHANLGLVWRKDDRVGLTDQGMPLLDALLADLVSGELVEA